MPIHCTLSSGPDWTTWGVIEQSSQAESCLEKTNLMRDLVLNFSNEGLCLKSGFRGCPQFLVPGLILRVLPCSLQNYFCSKVFKLFSPSAKWRKVHYCYVDARTDLLS